MLQLVDRLGSTEFWSRYAIGDVLEAAGPSPLSLMSPNDSPVSIIPPKAAACFSASLRNM